MLENILERYEPPYYLLVAPLYCGRFYYHIGYERSGRPTNTIKQYLQ